MSEKNDDVPKQIVTTIVKYLNGCDLDIFL